MAIELPAAYRCLTSTLPIHLKNSSIRVGAKVARSAGHVGGSWPHPIAVILFVTLIVGQMAASVGDLKLLKTFITSAKRPVQVISGAGVSTNSNIPDYRSPNGSYSRGHKPITHQQFVHHESFRKRYWLRSIIGWDTFQFAVPNPAHYALARLESGGFINGIITQNVDRLHSKAGSRNVHEIHGRNDIVHCLNPNCQCQFSRNVVQKQLALMNQKLLERIYDPTTSASELARRADGDTAIETNEEILREVEIVSCPKCSGVLKPQVVFFGDNVPPPVRLACNKEVDNCDALLVVGSSLEVFSVYQYIHQLQKRGVPVAIINKGPTRAEREGQPVLFKSEEDCSVLLDALANELVP